MRPLLLVALALLATACVDSARRESCDEAAVTLELELSGDALSPSNPALCRGQEVRLVVEARADGILHIHGYDDHIPATEVEADERVELDFTAERSGQFPIEFHPGGEPEGVSVGILTVHES